MFVADTKKKKKKVQDLLINCHIHELEWEIPLRFRVSDSAEAKETRSKRSLTSARKAQKSTASQCVCGAERMTFSTLTSFVKEK